MLTQVITQAKKLLATNPHDIGHDVGHHYQVWQNCFWIVRKEKIVLLDDEALQIAAWWHDYDRGSSEHPALRQTLKDFHYEEKFINKVVSDIINSHSFGQTQNTLEAKVLFDADKLEYSSIPRWEEMLQAAKDGMIEDQRIIEYKQAWNERISIVKNNLYFNCTRRRLLSELEEFIEWAKEKRMYKDGRII